MVKPDGGFYPSSEYVPDGRLKPNSSGTRQINEQEYKLEALAQMRRFEQLLGYKPMHIESHSILHDSILEALAEIGVQAGIHAVELKPHSDSCYAYAHELSISRIAQKKPMLISGARAEHFLEDEYNLLDSPYEYNVLHFHPGYLDAYILDNTSLTLPRCRDLEALCDPRLPSWFAEHDIELIRFDQLPKA